ncbi:MAG: hypothetical protein ABUL60_19545, partial [Myxococcales bacterium]
TGRENSRHRLYPARVGYRFGFRRGSGQRVISLAGAAQLCLGLNIPSARAASDGVVVTCPELPEARAAELEARARATVLTSELSATVAISCSGDGVVVRVEAGDDGVTLKLRVGAATLREEVLRALDRALAELRARTKPEVSGEGVANTTSGPTGPSAPEPEPAKPDAPPPVPVAPPPEAPRAEAASTRELAVGAQLMGESWGKHGAIGGGLGAGLSFDSLWWLGVRVGAVHPFGLSEVAILEGHALVEAAFTARALAGFRFGVAAGPSLLFVSPQSGFSAPGATLKSAARFEARLSRPFRFGRVELAPWLGLRFFSAQRGVRVAQHPRVDLSGALPQVGLALSLFE